MLKITINGEAKTFDNALTVAELVLAMGLAGRAVAVEVNRELVPKKAHASTKLQEGDQVEVVTLVGGG